MHIRTATPADAGAISAIASETFSLACPPGTPAEELERYIDENLTAASFSDVLKAGDCDVRVLVDNLEVIGFSLVDPAPEALGMPEADSIPQLSRCYVRQNYHGTGAAQMLLSATLDKISVPIRLMVNDQNSRAIRFYTRNGFITVGETHFQCGEDIHRDLVMVRKVG
jgi:ribosomal protein S18 acetylase RimI-like enzyme